MTIGVVGRKCGMTRIFTEEGVSIPVTVIEVEPNRVTQFKTEETDGLQCKSPPASVVLLALPKRKLVTLPVAGAVWGIPSGRRAVCRW